MLQRFRLWRQKRQAAKFAAKMEARQAELERKCSEIGELWGEYVTMLKAQGYTRQQVRAIQRDLITGRWQVGDWLGESGKPHRVKAH